MEENLRLLRSSFPGFVEMVRGKKVCDFGCGYGNQVAVLSAYGCDAVGIEANPSTLNAARKNCVGLKVSFSETVSNDMLGTFDVVISQNSMEHFDDPEKTLWDMVSLLKPGGILLITFGPPWFSPWGSHMHFFLPIPWVNILLPERLVMWIRSFFRNDGACRYEECESGLNKMTVARFESIIKPFGVKMLRHKCVKGLSMLSKLPLVRELFINNCSAVLAPSPE